MATASTKYTKTAIILHWLIGFGIIFMFLFGWYMEDLPKEAPKAMSFDLFDLEGFSRNSLKKPIPKIAPMAIWVELTGNPSVVAIKTVIADDNATQYALGAFNLVIFCPTVFINLGPNNNKPSAMNRFRVICFSRIISDWDIVVISREDLLFERIMN